MLHLEREIHEQPDVIARLLSEQTEATRAVAQAIRDFNPTFASIAARGTSDNAARYAQYLFGYSFGLATALATPSLHTNYEKPPDLSRALVIGISQSGQAEDVRRVLEDARRQGALTLSITNYPDSPMAQIAKYHLTLLSGEEISIAATKTYTAELTVIAMLANALSPSGNDELYKLPIYARETLQCAGSISTWAERYRYMEKFAVIGRGFNYATAFEISLKVKELAYISTHGYSEADFRHGPIAIIQPGFPILLVAPKGKVFSHLIDLLNQLNERKAECLVISNDELAFAGAFHQMWIPDIPEWLSPIVAVIPGQVFAMQQALIRGYEVDKPRGLKKVTVTT